MKNKFNVVHCANLEDDFGLANLIPAVSNCLIEDCPEAMLLTETSNWVMHFIQVSNDNVKEKPSFIRYVERALACPFSMLPTIYDLKLTKLTKLTNHLQLGSSTYIHLHDINCTRSPVSLKWLKVPGYSNNVKLATSSELQNAIGRLFKLCFIHPLTCCSTALFTDATLKKPKFLKKECRSDSLPYTPLTFDYFFHSMLKRSVWVEGTLDSLCLSAVPPPHQLTWRTVKVWMGGEPFLMFSIIQDSLKKCFENLVETSELFLVLLERSDHHRNRVGNNFIFSPQEMYFNWHRLQLHRRYLLG